MKALWAVDIEHFQAFLQGLALNLKAGMRHEHPHIEVRFPPEGAKITAGPIEDAARAGLPIRKEGALAVIHLAGPMMKDPGWLRFFGFTGTRDVSAALQAALRDDEVEQILLRIDSPGGTVDGTLELAETVRQANTAKRVIAQSDGMIASAAYWVASQAAAIYAGRMDLVGSIGVRMGLYDFSGMFEQQGIEAIPLDTGPFKSTGMLGAEVTGPQREYLQGLVDDQFGEFREAVMRGRGMSAEAFEAVGDGRVFSAPAALELGLIDRVQGIGETITNFKQQAVRKARLAFRRTA